MQRLAADVPGMMLPLGTADLPRDQIGGKAASLVRLTRAGFPVPDGWLLPGDVLVAHTTEPSWTPLFINAAAVLLEVGGELQHGALVAREYGKPCVAGIVNLTRSLTDGQMVEVDGDAGVVRLLSEPG